MSAPKDLDAEAAQAVKQCLSRLGEHFEAVQILATRTEEGWTNRCFKGAGNFYARMGMAQEFITEDQAKESAKQIAEQLNEGDDHD